MSGTKKKILYVITKSNFGGAQRYVYDLASYVNDNESFDVSVLLGGQGELSRRLSARGVRTIAVRALGRDLKPLLDLAAFFSLVNVFRQEKPDVIHLNSSKVGILGALAGRVTGCKNIIFTVHGWAFTEDRPAPMKLVFACAQWISVALAHTTITVSENTRKEARHFPFVQPKLTTIYNGVKTIRFKERREARAELARIYGIPERSFWIASVGELHKNKGHLYGIAAAGRLHVPRTRPIAFIAFGEGEERGAIQQFIFENGLYDIVHLPGHHENIECYLSAFDCFLFPSVKEGLPYAILEAGSAGLPIVASEVGGIPEVVDGTETGYLVRPKDIDGLARALNHVFSMPGIPQTFSKNVRKKIEEQFSFEQMAQKTCALYR